MKKLAFLLVALVWIGLCFDARGFAQETESAPDSAEVTSDSDVSEGDDAKPADHADQGDHEEHGDDHGGEIHLENDPMHGNISEKTWALIDFRSDMAAFSTVVFLLLLVGVGSTAWKPIMEGLQKREETIAGNISAAEKAKVEAETKLADYEAKLASANEEAIAIVAEARKDAEATGQKVLAEAQEEAQRLRERATADIESAKRVALADLANQSTDVAMSLAQRVVGREVKAEDHQGLIQEMLSNLPSNN